MNNKYLLTDEVELCKQDFDEREKLIRIFLKNETFSATDWMFKCM